MQNQTTEARRKKWIFWAALLFNIGLLGYFKYLNFFFDNIAMFTAGYNVEKIILPIGLSFYTFQQISYQVDIYAGRSKPQNFLDYSLFVSFFPQLISGPIVHHAEMLPQFARKNFQIPKARNLLLGLCVFSIGLFKKIVLADSFALIANPVFDGTLSPDANFTFVSAWVGALAYAFQLYFDFSGYSDMAVGLGIMFGIKLPFNFYSPLKARNMVEFWSRWHISLTREVNNLLYNPLSMNMMRKAVSKKMGKLAFFAKTVAMPTLIIWFIVGAWHGAGWNYILMGLTFGLCILFNHFMKDIVYKDKSHPVFKHINGVPVAIAVPATFFAYVIAVVLFRSENVTAAMEVYSAMFTPVVGDWADIFTSIESGDWLLLLAGGGIIWMLPNSIEYFSRYKVGIDVFSWQSKKRPPMMAWRMNIAHVLFCAILALIGLYYIAGNFSEFIYFAF